MYRDAGRCRHDLEHVADAERGLHDRAHEHRAGLAARGALRVRERLAEDADVGHVVGLWDADAVQLGDHDGLEVVAAHASVGRDRVGAREHRHAERLQLPGHRREDPPGVDLVRERGEVLEIQAERVHPVRRRAQDPVGVVPGTKARDRIVRGSELTRLIIGRGRLLHREDGGHSVNEVVRNRAVGVLVVDVAEHHVGPGGGPRRSS